MNRSNPTLPPDLAHSTVDVWRVTTDQPGSRVDPLRALLADDELQRADRFYFEKDRQRFTVTRGVLRRILGSYLQVTPHLVVFEYSQHGKPSLAGESNPRGIRFNVSHSHEVALFAFTIQREVGVDVEFMRTNLDVEALARHSFSAWEVEVLMRLSPEQRREGFFNCWTRKEAFIKAHGEGLSLGLSRFDVTLAPGETAALRRFEVDPTEVAKWELCALEAPAGYKAALAVEGHDWQIRCWDYPWDVLE